RARNRQQLEERAAAEQIEVVRIQMVIVTKAIARFTNADPAVLDSTEAAHSHRPPLHGAPPCQHGESRYGKERRQSRVADPRVDGGPTRERRLSGVQTLAILGRGRSGHRWRDYIGHELRCCARGASGVLRKRTSGIIALKVRTTSG